MGKNGGVPSWGANGGSGDLCLELVRGGGLDSDPSLRSGCVAVCYTDPTDDHCAEFCDARSFPFCAADGGTDSAMDARVTRDTGILDEPRDGFR